MTDFIVLILILTSIFTYKVVCYNMELFLIEFDFYAIRFYIFTISIKIEVTAKFLSAKNETKRANASSKIKSDTLFQTFYAVATEK